MIEMRRAQLSFGDGLIAEEISDLRDDWMQYADQVLAVNAKNPSALYLRGLARLGRGQDGDADIQAAKAMDFRIEEVFASMGLKRLTP